ncbi:ABC transporter permease [Vagococcus jeotgali]|uniref:ABC transporter permease n=1 Tax=Vagococcus jeotgali TaxID=3109030 RepID=UPI002DDBE046|nr:ABC transporter permease [Vagococcus sp. B2T-5]
MEIKKEEKFEKRLYFFQKINLNNIKNMDLKKKAIYKSTLIILLLLSFYSAGFFISDDLLQPDFSNKNLPPSFIHFFGTDWMGRDVFYRTLKGFNLSMTIGVLASLVSSLLAVFFGIISALGSERIDKMLSWVIDLMLGIPQLLLLILISVSVGAGIEGVVIGLILTHWISLARLIRGEVKKLKGQHYIKVSKRLGKSTWWIMIHHITPHILPVFLVGLILMFPHAIMHESALSFLGLGIPPEKPSIGVMLGDSLKYLSSGVWWAVIFPGIFLVITVLLTDRLVSYLNNIFET